MTGAMNAYWLEQTAADVPASNHWLSARETSRLASLRFARRRTDWRLGRWTAKRALASCLHLSGDIHSLREIEIHAAPSGAPEVFLFNQRAAVSLSLSHRAGRAFCVIAFSAASLGCDLELVEARDNSFVADFFTGNERKLMDNALPDERSLLTTLLWSAKESALKAMHVGLRLDTMLLDVSPTFAPPPPTEVSRLNICTGWSPLFVRYTDTQILHGWWQCANGMVRTVVFNRLRQGTELSKLRS